MSNDELIINSYQIIKIKKLFLFFEYAADSINFKNILTHQYTSNDSFLSLLNF